MEHLNQTLFLWINAPEHPSVLVTALAIFCAQWLIWSVPVFICIAWLRGSENIRKALLVAIATGVFGLLVNLVIGWFWPHPRPFMIGLGHTLIVHAADASFPSNHLTLLLSVTVSFLLQRELKMVGIVFALLAFPVAWSRIYLGVHFPLDMLGAIAVSSLCAVLALRASRWFLEPLYRLVIRIHSRLFAKLITQGWVRA